MQEIDCLERNRDEIFFRRRQLAKTIASITSLAGYVIVGVLVGMYLDNRFFNNNGIAVIIGFIVGIIGITINVIRLVILSRDTQKDKET